MTDTFRNNFHDTGFSAVPHDVLDDKRLSWKAKGILAYFIGRPDGWNFKHEHLESLSTDGRHALNSGIDELIDAGYLSREQKRTDGQLDGYLYTLHRYSQPDEPPSEGVSDQCRFSAVENLQQKTNSHSKNEVSKNEQTNSHARESDEQQPDAPHWAERIDVDELPADRPRMDPMQFAARYGERHDCRGLMQDTDKAGRLRWLCEHVDARMLAKAIDATAHAPKTARWDLVDIWVEVLMRDPNNAMLMRPDEFRESYREATGHKFSLHKTDRLRWVVTQHEAELVAAAIGRTYSAEHPGWRYFSKTLNGMREERNDER